MIRLTLFCFPVLLAGLAVPWLSPDPATRTSAQRLGQMTPEEREEIRRNRQRFENLSPQEQARLRGLHHELMQREDREQLLTVLDRYSDWLRTLRPTERAELLSLPPTERLEKIRELRRREYQERFGLTGESGLDQDDLANLYTWVEGFVKQQSGIIERRLRSDESGDRTDRIVRMALRQPERMRPWAVFFAYTRSSPESALRLVTTEHIDELRDVLSPQALRILDDQPSDLDKQRLVHRWIVAAVNSRLRPKVSDEELQRFYDTQLTQAERERLDTYTPELWWRELQRLYYARQATSIPPFLPPWLPLSPDDLPRNRRPPTIPDDARP